MLIQTLEMTLAYSGANIISPKRLLVASQKLNYMLLRRL